jgi:hypothetical protein
MLKRAPYRSVITTVLPAGENGLHTGNIRAVVSCGQEPSLDPLLIWLESTSLNEWIIGSPSLFAFPGILALHAIGMGFAAGLSAAIDLRILGVARAVPLPEMRRLLPILWAGFWLNAASGILLLIGYPTKALTNPVFYLKLTLIAVAMVLVRYMDRQLVSPPEATSRAAIRLRRLAMVSLACWAGAVTAGRLLAYTYTRLTADEFISAIHSTWFGGSW